MGRTFPLKRFKATKRPLVSTDCGVWKSVWSTAGKFMSVWKCVMDAVLYGNLLWQLKGVRIASNNKDAILHRVISQFVFYEKLFE